MMVSNSGYAHLIESFRPSDLPTTRYPRHIRLMAILKLRRLETHVYEGASGQASSQANHFIATRLPCRKPSSVGTYYIYIRRVLAVRTPCQRISRSHNIRPTRSRLSSPLQTDTYKPSLRKSRIPDALVARWFSRRPTTTTNKVPVRLGFKNLRIISDEGSSKASVTLGLITNPSHVLAHPQPLHQGL